MKNEKRIKSKSRTSLGSCTLFLFLILQTLLYGSGRITTLAHAINTDQDLDSITQYESNHQQNSFTGEGGNLYTNTNSYANKDSERELGKDTQNHYKSVIFDAGSTGTRVHIYNYKIIEEENKDDDIKIFIPSLNFKITPGLVYLLNNYFEGDKEEFELYFQKIKNFLDQHIKEEERSSTAIIFRASGGFRLLSISVSNQYISFLKKYFYEHFSEYLLIDDLFVKVLSGKEEAILSFIAINALLKKFTPNPLVFPLTAKNKGENPESDEDTNGNQKEQTEPTHINTDSNSSSSSSNNDNNRVSEVANEIDGLGDSTAIVEIGGASAQIVVQLPLSKINDDVSNFFNYKSVQNDSNNFIKENYKKKNIVKIKLFHKDIFLYCKSYLVLGRQNVMKTYLHYVVHTNNMKRGRMKKFIPVSCFPKNFKFHIDKLFKTSIEEDIYVYNRNKILDKNEYIGVGTGNIKQCRKEMQKVLDYSKIDILPFKLKKFIKVYAIENFHHFVTDILNIPDEQNPLLIDTDMYLKKAEELCPSTVEEIIKLINPSANLEKAQTSCFGLIFLYEFLRHIFKIDRSIKIYSSNYVNNISITWTIAVLIIEIPAYINIIKKRKAQEVQKVQKVQEVYEASYNDEL